MLTGFGIIVIRKAKEFGFVFLAVYNLIKDRNKIQFLLSLFLAVIAVALDIIWLQARLH